MTAMEEDSYYGVAQGIERLDLGDALKDGIMERLKDGP